MSVNLAWLRRRHKRNAKTFDSIGPLDPSSPSSTASPPSPSATPSEEKEDEDCNQDCNLLADLPLNLSQAKLSLPSLTPKGADQRATKCGKSNETSDRVTRSAPVKGSIALSVNPKQYVSSPLGQTYKAHQNVGDRRLSLPCPAPKSLSYSDDDFNEIIKAIESEAPGLDWFGDVWADLLQGKRTGKGIKLPVKSLGGWVEVYNRWQALGNWTPGNAPVLVDAAQLQLLTSAPKLKVAEWMKAFGDKKCTAKLNMPAFLCTCIVLANTISKKQKLRFLLGVFDENDNGSFEQVEFESFISGFFQGIACTFDVVLKNRAQISRLAKNLFARICADLSSEYSGSLSSLSFSRIESWLSGETGDPLAIPYALFLQRHSQGGDDPEMFSEEGTKFRLSHRGPVDPPMELAMALDASFLRRSEMQVVREVFRCCETRRSFDISHVEAEEVTRLEIDPNLWCNKLARGLEEIELLRLNGRKVSMDVFLKKICPRAHPHHLQMFNAWLQEVQVKDELQIKVGQSRDIMERFEEYQGIPVLEQVEKLQLLKDYDFLQFELRTSRSIEALLPATSSLLAFEQEILEGTLSQEDIIALMCPPDCRPREGSKTIDGVVWSFLRLGLAREQKQLAWTAYLFANYSTCAKEFFYKPKVPQRHASLWNDFLEVLDPENTGKVTLKQMLRTGLLCAEVAIYMCHQIGKGKDEFSREEFIAEMIKISDFRP